MDKLYTGKKISIVEPSVAAALQHVEMEQLKKKPVEFPEHPHINTRQSSPLEKKFNRFAKRSFDVVVSILAIVCILSWLIPLMAIIIKLDSKGPIFFLQKRKGLNGKIFTCIKFRSMFINDEAHLLAEQQNDKRITRPGKFLRLMHTDELPQFFNVLRGDMSIIGPRPYMISENILFEDLFAIYSYRHTVKPGMTGFAQSFGNYGACTDLQKLNQRIHLDILYIQKWSPAMDLKILVRTIRMLVRKVIW